MPGLPILSESSCVRQPHPSLALFVDRVGRAVFVGCRTNRLTEIACSKGTLKIKGTGKELCQETEPYPQPIAMSLAMEWGSSPLDLCLVPLPGEWSLPLFNIEWGIPPSDVDNPPPPLGPLPDTTRFDHRELPCAHPPKKRYPCTFPGCFKTFSQKYNATAHRRTHTRESLVPCVVCGKQFTRRADVTRHHKDVHLREQIPCSYCPSKFRRQDALKWSVLL